MKLMLLIAWLTLLEFTSLQDSGPARPTESLHSISAFSTSFNPGQEARNHNIRLAASILNGRRIEAGQEFSFNEAIGDRSAEKGFLKAPYLEFGEKFDLEGGGICLVSSVLYMAAVLADMEILERYPHSRQSPYIAPGNDATVDFGQKDLKFRNKLNRTVIIRTSIVGSRLIIDLCSSAPLPYRIGLHFVRSIDADGMLQVRMFRDYSHEGHTFREQLLSEDIYPIESPRITNLPETPLEHGVSMPH